MIGNFVEETANNPGTGTNINLAGAPAGRKTFRSTFATAAVFFYAITDGTQEEWGVGTLTWGSPDILARTTVLGNSAGTTARLNFTGAIRVFNEIPAERALYIGQSGVPNVSGDVFQTPAWGGLAGGSNTSLTVTLTPAPAAYTAGMIVRFISQVNPTGAWTLNVNGLGAYYVLKKTGIYALSYSGAGDIRSGDVVEVVWDGSQWRQITSSNMARCPVGAIIPWTAGVLPDGWTWPDGRNLLRGTNSELNTLYGNAGYPYGSGDGSTTFGIPDLRGRMIAGLDQLGYIAFANRLVNTFGGSRGTLGAVGGSEDLASHYHNIADPSHAHSGSTDVQGAHGHTITLNARSGNSAGALASAGWGNDNAQYGPYNAGTSTDGAHWHNVTVNAAYTGIGFTAYAGAGSGGNMPPTMLLNYILYTGGW